MRSKLAEQLQKEQTEEIQRLTPEARLALLRRIRETGLPRCAAVQGLDFESTARQIRRSRQDGRPYSRCMDESSR